VAKNAFAAWFTAEEAIMGTAIKVELWDENEIHANQAIRAVMREMHRINDQYSPYRAESELSQVNRLAASEEVKISPELFELLQRSLEFSRLSDGAFDITFASVGYMYDYRKNVAPNEREITNALPAINFRNIVLDAAARTVRFTRPGVRIDLGGIAKGHAVDRGVDILRRYNIQQGLVSAGGDSRILGDRQGRPWMTGIRDPRQPSGSAVVLPLSNTAISTSGDYERYFIRDGVRIHHILSPKTGKPAHVSRSVTILGPDATTTDALSTTVFVLGADKGLQLVERMDGIDAIVIDANGRLHYSSGLQPPETAKPSAAKPPP
jgi:thiamine biosynthesis lipoprotein